MNKITHQIPGKWELGLFKQDPYLTVGKEVADKGYKRIPISAAHLCFTPPSNHIWWFDGDGGLWHVKPGKYSAYALRDGIPFIEHSFAGGFPKGGTITIKSAHFDGKAF